MFIIDKIIKDYLKNDDILLKMDINNYDVTNIYKLNKNNNDIKNIFSLNLIQNENTVFYECEINDTGKRICLQYTCEKVEYDDISNVSILLKREINELNINMISEYLLTKDFNLDIDNISHAICLSSYEILDDDTIFCDNIVYSYLTKNGKLLENYFIPTKLDKYDDDDVKNKSDIFINKIYPLLYAIDYMNNNQFRYKKFYGDKRYIYKILV